MSGSRRIRLASIKCSRTVRALSELRPKVPGFELSLGLWKRPDAAVIGRRKERRLTEL